MEIANNCEGSDLSRDETAEVRREGEKKIKDQTLSRPKVMGLT